MDRIRTARENMDIAVNRGATSYAAMSLLLCGKVVDPTTLSESERCHLMPSATKIAIDTLLDTQAAFETNDEWRALLADVFDIYDNHHAYVHKVLRIDKVLALRTVIKK